MCDCGMPNCLQMMLGIGVLGLMALSSARGQPTGAAPDSSKRWHDYAWTQIVEQNGVIIDYIYYPDADNEQDGIVLRLTNTNDFAVRYAFTVVFRSPESDTSTGVRGRLDPGQMKTGDAAGLFWMPFTDSDQSIGEVGLRGLEVVPVRIPPPEPKERRRMG